MAYRLVGGSKHFAMEIVFISGKNGGKWQRNLDGLHVFLG